MNLQQRQSSPADEADLEITAELPVLDVLAYEANAAAMAATGTHAALSEPRENLSSTDTWIIPAPGLRGPKPAASDVANTAIDENRAQLEVNLHALSRTLRDVEDRLTRKGERLAEIEQALQSAVTERNASDQRAHRLSDEAEEARTTAASALARIAELQKAIQERDAADEVRRARETDLQTQLIDRNSQAQAQLAAINREFEAKLATRTQAQAVVERELSEARSRAAGYLETLQSNEGRRSVFEDLIATLDADVDRRDTRIANLETDLATHTARARDLESELRERVARVSALDKQVSALTSALSARTEQHTDVEQARESLQQTVNSLSGTLTERNDRLKVLEGTVAQQTITAAQLRGELERSAAERAQLVSGAAALEAALKAASLRGDEFESAARAAQGRGGEAETALIAQRKRVEQLEAETGALRTELHSSNSALHAAGVERSEHLGRLAAVDARVVELEARVADQQETVRLLQAEANSSVARAKELEGDLRAAEDTINRLEADARGKSARVDELEKMNQEWRATVEEARHAITDRDGLIQRLEQETANSAVLIGHIQKSITRLDSTAEHPQREPAAEGATRLLIRTDGDMEVVHVLGRKTTVGRTPDNDLQIDAKFISRHHAVILAGPAHAIIEDLNSTNGVLVNNRRITRQPLKDGDNVMIGKTQFRFVVRPQKISN